MAETTKTKNSNAAIIVALWAAVLLTVFIAFRSSDLWKLPVLVGNLGGGALAGADIGYSAFAIIVAGAICVSWFGLGSLILGFVGRPENENPKLTFVQSTVAGAVVWSLIWFFVGLGGAYSQIAGIVSVVIGWAAAGIAILRKRSSVATDSSTETRSAIDNVLIAVIAIPLALAFVASLAPPIAKDSLLYHFALPKAFIAQGSNAFIEGNIASYLALGTEMHSVWAMLLGNMVSPRAGEAAIGATVFLSFPLLLTAIFGWARHARISRTFSLIAAAMVAVIPTAFHVASSGYVDLTLALYVTLAVYSLTRWWKTLERSSLVLAAIFLGGALTVKLTAVFVVAAFALIVLLRARGEPGGRDPSSDESGGVSSQRIVLAGFGALLLAGVIASPWYLRNWAATGSPVFPFYVGILKGTANGWDVERSNLLQTMIAQYGGADVDKTNYLMSPFRLSLAAQPENPPLYDGVLGAAFLVGLPLLVWALWKRRLADEFAIAAGVAGLFYIFWLFSGPQLRYVLPIMPLLALATVASIESMREDIAGKTAAKYSLLAAAFAAMLTSVAWFCMKAPLRVVLGGEARDQYLERNLDYYPFYQAVNNGTTTDSKVWLINMRRDTYHIDRPVFSDYIFEDWTLRKMLWESQSVQELRAKTAAMGIKYVLTRHDFLLDFDRSALIDEKRSRAENEAKMKIAREFILDPANTIKADGKFSLIKVFSE